MNSSNFFTPSEMRSIEKTNPLQWANDFLFQHIMNLAHQRKELILNALHVSNSAVLFRFNTVQWNHTLRDEKDLLGIMLHSERTRYRKLKKEKKLEIEEKCRDHTVQCGTVKATIRSVLQHTDLLSRLHAEFGLEFGIVWTMQKKIGFDFDFATSDPQYITMDCTITLEYKPELTKQDMNTVTKYLNKAIDYYWGYESPYNMECITLNDQPVARHLLFEDA